MVSQRVDGRRSGISLPILSSPRISRWWRGRFPNILLHLKACSMNSDFSYLGLYMLIDHHYKYEILFCYLIYCIGKRKYYDKPNIFIFDMYLSWNQLLYIAISTHIVRFDSYNIQNMINAIMHPANVNSFVDCISVVCLQSIRLICQNNIWFTCFSPSKVKIYCVYFIVALGGTPLYK